LAALFAASVESRAWLTRLLLGLGGAGLAAVLLAEGWLWKSLRLGNGTMLVLTGATACLVVGLHWHGASTSAPPPRALGWLRSFGRLSYEIYLAHMFVVFAVVALWKATGITPYWSFLAYVPGVLGSWALGALVARAWSLPWERVLRQSPPTRDNDAGAGPALASQRP
jgi:peptidoglycan/LPS O-acetylase OafA/YrhL